MLMFRVSKILFLIEIISQKCTRCYVPRHNSILSQLDSTMRHWHKLSDVPTLPEVTEMMHDYHVHQVFVTYIGFRHARLNAQSLSFRTLV